MIYLNMKESAEYLGLKVGSFKTYIIKGIIPEQTKITKNKNNQNCFMWSIKSLSGCSKKISQYRIGAIVTDKERARMGRQDKRLDSEAKKEKRITNLFNDFMGIKVEQP